VLEDPWHPQQQVHPRRDGDVELSVPAAHELDIIPRVLALGPEAELLAPPSSRQEMARLIQAMAARYASGDA
jgi:predicted DNA-binding transcriptional regulator YafY